MLVSVVDDVSCRKLHLVPKRHWPRWKCKHGLAREFWPVPDPPPRPRHIAGEKDEEAVKEVRNVSSISEVGFVKYVYTLVV